MGFKEFNNKAIKWGYNLLSLGTILLFLTSCTEDSGKADAYGNFEAEETIISSEENGRLLSINIKEGDIVKIDELIGVIDTTFLHIKRLQLLASREASDASLNQISKTAAVQNAQLDLLNKELSRSRELAESNAITQQKFDQVEAEVIIARRKLDQILSQNVLVRAEQSVIDAQIDAINEQISRCKIKAVIKGTVLQKYIELGELVSTGKPLIKIADLNNIFLRAYISGYQLSEIKIGQNVTVRYDKGTDGYYYTNGKISWIASTAEFTPKIIQTREERVDLVYAIKVIVENDGSIKIGMPGEVIFKPEDK